METVKPAIKAKKKITEVLINAQSSGAHSAPPAGADRFARARSRIKAAFTLADPVEPPIIVWPFHYIVCGTNPKFIPPGLFDDPARLLEFQTGFCRRHLEAVEDDFQPYLTPYYGTGILASAFGCRISFQPRRDPAVEAPCLQSPQDVAKMRLPDPGRDGLMPRTRNSSCHATRVSLRPLAAVYCISAATDRTWARSFGRSGACGRSTQAPWVSRKTSQIYSGHYRERFR